NCHLLQEFHFAEARWITDKSISCIINSCPNLRNLNIAYSKGDIKDASMLIQGCLSIEYLDFSGAMAFWNDELIIAIIKGSPNLRHLEIGHNGIGDESYENEIASTIANTSANNPSDDNFSDTSNITDYFKEEGANDSAEGEKDSKKSRIIAKADN
ncbi:1434_t:CDS:2, partial [Funneliformis geosporum]